MKKGRTDPDELYFQLKLRVTSTFLVKMLGAFGGAGGIIYLCSQLLN